MISLFESSYFSYHYIYNSIFPIIFHIWLLFIDICIVNKYFMCINNLYIFLPKKKKNNLYIYNIDFSTHLQYV